MAKKFDVSISNHTSIANNPHPPNGPLFHLDNILESGEEQVKGSGGDSSSSQHNLSLPSHLSPPCGPLALSNGRRKTPRLPLGKTQQDESPEFPTMTVLTVTNLGKGPQPQPDKTGPRRTRARTAFFSTFQDNVKPIPPAARLKTGSSEPHKAPLKNSPHQTLTGYTQTHSQADKHSSPLLDKDHSGHNSDPFDLDADENAENTPEKKPADKSADKSYVAPLLSRSVGPRHSGSTLVGVDKEGSKRAVPVEHWKFIKVLS